VLQQMSSGTSGFPPHFETVKLRCFFGKTPPFLPCFSEMLLFLLDTWLAM
jgi:hypothetical protein